VIWGVFLAGLLLTLLGSMSSAALVYVSRAELARAVSRQLRGGSSALAWLSRIEAILTASAATSAFGVILLGAAFPALFARSGAAFLAPLVALVAVPFALFSGYLAPRWITASHRLGHSWAALAGFIPPGYGRWGRNQARKWTVCGSKISSPPDLRFHRRYAQCHGQRRPGAGALRQLFRRSGTASDSEPDSFGGG